MQVYAIEVVPPAQVLIADLANVCDRMCRRARGAADEQCEDVLLGVNRSGDCVERLPIGVGHIADDLPHPFSEQASERRCGDHLMPTARCWFLSVTDKISASYRATSCSSHERVRPANALSDSVMA